jgi:hypothetical protein
VAELSDKTNGSICSREDDALWRQTEKASCSSDKPTKHAPSLAWTARMSTTDSRTDVPFRRAEHTPGGSSRLPRCCSR